MKTKITGGNPHLLAGVFDGKGIVNTTTVDQVLIVGTRFLAVESLGKWYLVREWLNNFDFCAEQLSKIINVDDIKRIPVFPEELRFDNITVKKV